MIIQYTYRLWQRQYANFYIFVFDTIFSLPCIAAIKGLNLGWKKNINFLEKDCISKGIAGVM